MTDVQKIVKASEGYCKADQSLRDAINHAVLGYGNTAVIDENGNEIADVTIKDDRSEHAYNAENTVCCISIITPRDGSAPITVGYYSDGGQHTLDIVDAEDDADSWAQGWDRDGCVPMFLWGAETEEAD